MKKNLILTLCLAGGLMIVSAQTKNGGISQQMLQDIQKEQLSKPTNKALLNAISGLSIDDQYR